MAKIKATPRGLSLKERLVTRSKAGPNGCIDFVGYIDSQGRGRIRIGGRKGEAIIAARASYEAHIGPIPDGLKVLHTCDRPICINPDHLYPGTDAENVFDKVIRGRAARILTAAAIPKIRRDQRLQRVIAEEHGISQVMVSRIKLGKAWTHIP